MPWFIYHFSAFWGTALNAVLCKKTQRQRSRIFDSHRSGWSPRNKTAGDIVIHSIQCSTDQFPYSDSSSSNFSIAEASVAVSGQSVFAFFSFCKDLQICWSTTAFVINLRSNVIISAGANASVVLIYSFYRRLGTCTLYIDDFLVSATGAYILILKAGYNPIVASLILA